MAAASWLAIDIDVVRERLTTFLTTMATVLTHINYRRYFHFSLPSAASVNFYSDVICRAIFLFKVVESVRYIYRRKRGTRGPGALVPLIQFWVCLSLHTTLSRMLVVFLIPIPITAFLRLLSILPLLSPASVVSLYALICQHVFEPLEPHAEDALRRLRERCSKSREWGIVVMDELIKRYTVGGMKAVIAAFQEEQPSNPREPVRLVPERDIAVNMNRTRNLPALRHELFDDDGAEVLSKVRRSVVVSAKPVEPKPAYSDSRKLRESFRRRAAASRKEGSSQQ